jgi:hypothetical protein
MIMSSYVLNVLLNHLKYNIMLDKKGFLLEIGQDVNVPDPNDSDIHNHSFIGYVNDILEDRGTAIIEDQDSDFFEIETERLEIRN